MRFRTATKFILVSFVVVLGTWGISSKNTLAAEGASLLFHPNTGEYYVGGTFDVSIVLNTNNQSINTVRADIKFPQDKIQVVIPALLLPLLKFGLRRLPILILTEPFLFKGEFLLLVLKPVKESLVP